VRTRERATWRDGYVLAVIGGFLVYCLGPSLIGLKTLLSVNLLSNFYPWIAQHGDDLSGHQACTGDTVDSVMPGIAAVRSDLFAGHIANWQSVIAGGTPLAAVPDLGLLDPVSLPYFVLPLWLAPAFVVLLQIVVAIGGTFLFLRRLHLRRPAALLGGLIYATTGFMVVWTNWPQTRVAALIPALFWSIERLLQERRVRDVALVAVVVASMLLGGFPTVTGYALYLATGYLIVRIVVIHGADLRRGLRTLALAAVGLVVGFLLAMVQILPFLYFYAHGDLGYRSGDSSLGLPLAGLVTLVAPNSYGLCVFGKTDHGVFNPIELVAYVGSAALILAVAGAAFGLGRRRFGSGAGARGYFVAACVVIIALAWASPSLRSVVSGLPVFAGNFIGRIRSVLGFALAVLAAVGFDWMTSERDGAPLRQRRIAKTAWSAAVWVGVAAFGLIVLRQAHRSAFSGGYLRSLEHALIIPGLLLVLATAVLAGSRLKMVRSKDVAFVVVPVLVAAQAAQFFHTVLPGDSKANFYPRTGTHQFLAANLGPNRFGSSDRTMYTATALYYGLRTPTGHQFHDPVWEDLLKAVDPGVMSTPTFSDFTTAINQDNVGNQPILDRMAVKYFVLEPAQLAGDAVPLPPAKGAVSAGAGPATCTLPAEPIRGVTFELARAVSATDANRGFAFRVEVRDGARVISSGRYMGTSAAAGTQVSVAVAGEDIPRAFAPLVVTIAAVGADGGLSLAAVNGSVACAPVTPRADGLRVVYADDGSIVYQRLDSLPRIRWASGTVVVPTAPARLAALQRGVPGNDVVLDSPGPPASGRPATVSVTKDGNGDIAAEVTADGGGYLVVADAMQQPGWSATVDGAPARLVPADDAMVAVYVPAGSHRVSFDYSTPGQTVGVALTGLGFVATIVAFEWERIQGWLPVVNRRRRVRAAREDRTP
jgi:hypothetical protein